MRHGQGEQTWADGTKYTGEYQNDQAHGDGRIEQSDGNVYEG